MAAQLPATGPFGGATANATEYAPLETGRRIGKYRLVYPIGEGGMSVVYLAQDEVLDRRVAIKVLHRHLARDPEARARFSREARAVARLTHRNIPEIYDFSDSNSEGPSFLVTEYIDGAPLARILRDFREQAAAGQGSMLLPEIGVMLTLGVAHALAHAHAQNVVHRDVKPENVLVGKDGVVKLTDFGIAQVRGLESMTMTGTLIGSPAHMAPEQIETARDVDQRVDVWGLGTVLYMAVTGGHLPFEADNPHRLLKKIVDGHYADPRRLSPHVDSRLAEIVARCLVVDRDKRYATVAAVSKDLDGWLAERGLGAAEVEIRAFMADPEGASTMLARRLGTALMALGEKASQGGDRSAALEYFGRVLVLDPEREDALVRVRKLEKQLRARKGARRALAAALVGGAAVGIGFLVIPADSPVAPVTVSLSARALGRAKAPGPPELAPPAPPVTAGQLFGDALGPELERADVRLSVVAETEARETPRRDNPSEGRPDKREERTPKAPPAPVPVRLTVFPPAVRITVDGHALAPGAETALLPGRYRVVLVHAGCSECLPDERTLVVPEPVPGQATRVDQHYVFEKRTAALEPATLLVRCSDGAYVTDSAGKRYECNIVHSLPVTTPEPELITLTAHAADGARLRQQQFTLSPRRPIVWSL